MGRLTYHAEKITKLDQEVKQLRKTVAGEKNKAAIVGPE
jgi:hypothetical protein